MAQGELNHLDIPADDLDRAQRFYSGVFGWSFSQMEGYEDYHMFRSGPGEIGGGIGKRGTTAPDVLRPYMTVDSLDAALAKATELGGSVVVPRVDMEGMGAYAAVKDTEGNEIGIWEDKRDSQS